MTLRYYYRDNAGDVVEIINPSRIRRTGTEASYQAEEGAVGTWTLEVDDPDGTFNVRGFRILYAQEDEAVADDQHGVIGVWYTGDRSVSRLSTDSPAKRTEAGRTWSIQLHDLNTRFSWRINVGNDCDRPAETDLERIAWLIGTNEFAFDDGDTTYIDTDEAVDMDAVDYTGQALLDVIDDCAQQSGRNYGLLWHYSGDPDDPVAISLWYKFADSTDYSSTKKISNRIGVADGVDVYFPSLDARLDRSPSRVAWGVYQTYDSGGDGSGAVYVTNPVTAERFNKIDVIGKGENIKSETQARYRATRYANTVSSVEQDRIEVSVDVAPEDVNGILPFHRIEVDFTHLPGYDELDDYLEPAYVWMRVAERTVRDIAPGLYELGLTLFSDAHDTFEDEPPEVPAFNPNIRASLYHVSGPYPLPSGPVYFNAIPSLPWELNSGPFDMVASGRAGAQYAGIEITDDGVLQSVAAKFSSIGVALGVNEPYTVTYELLHNGVAIDSHSDIMFVEGASNLYGNLGPVLSVTNLEVSAGDVISCRLSCLPVAMEMFRCPLGIEMGYIQIRGGYFPP